MVAAPAETPVTRPEVFTVATDVLPEDHATGSPVMGLPRASSTLAASWRLPPMSRTDMAGPSVTDPGVTVRATEPTFPAALAVIVTDPTATPVTEPPSVTVASAGLLDAHVTACPGTDCPSPVSGVADSDSVAATATVAAAGATEMEATRGPVSTGEELLQPASSAPPSSRTRVAAPAR